MWTECNYRRHLRTFAKVLGADKDCKVHRHQTLGNTGGNNNKDTMFDWRSGCQSEDKRNCHIYVTSFMVITFFHKQRTLYICAVSFVAFVCILYQVSV